LPPEEHDQIEQVPGSLPEVLAALAADNDYLLEGDVFTQDLIETWIEWKTVNEVDPIRFRPHPHEFEMYYDL
jgi:glutamine synthetase